MSKIFVITGQTATGKTKHALELANKLDGELINCDSRQIYKHLNIITGKDLPNNDFHKVQLTNNFDIGFHTFGDTKMWLYDIIDPKQHFSSFDYSELAHTVINDIRQRNKTPIIVGGSYFYLKQLLYGIDIHVKPNWELRKRLDLLSVEQLQQELDQLRPQELENMNESDRQNPRRLMRKIEVVSATHKDLSTPKLIARDITSQFDIEIIGLRYNSKERLTQAISKRVEERLKQGALEEVKNLLQKGYTLQDPGLKTIGYPQVVQYLHEEISFDEMKKLWITKELQYAKRQYTFMKTDSNITWTDI